MSTYITIRGGTGNPSIYNRRILVIFRSLHAHYIRINLTNSGNPLLWKTISHPQCNQRIDLAGLVHAPILNRNPHSLAPVLNG